MNRSFSHYFISFIFTLCCLLGYSPNVTAEISKNNPNSLISVEAAATEAKINHLTLPSPELDGRIQTLNKKGAMAPEIDRITASFLEKIQGKTVLEIGAGYGNVIMKAIGKGYHLYVVNDLDIRHLQIAAVRIQEKAQNEKIPLKELQKIKLYPGNYPSKIRLENNSFDAILIARVLHFFSPEQLQAAIHKSYQLLKPGGKVYILAITPYVKRYSSFIPEYEKRLKAGEKYPGFVQSLIPYLSKETTEKERQSISPDPFMFLDSRVLRQTFTEAGFKVEFSKELPLSHPSKIWQLDGRENVGLIAEKPRVNKIR